MIARFGRHFRQQFVGYIAVFIALGGVSYAAVALPKNSVGSEQIAKGAVRSSDLGKNAVNSAKVKDGSLLPQDFAPGTITGPSSSPGPQGPTGPQGAKGDAGTDGAPGASATKLWAVVDAAGAVVRSSGGVTAFRGDTGAYLIDFNQDVESCARVATIGNPSFDTATLPHGVIKTTQHWVLTSDGTTPIAAPEIILVNTATVAGAASDRPFHLALFC